MLPGVPGREAAESARTAALAATEVADPTDAATADGAAPPDVEEERGPNVADGLDLVARALYVNGKRKGALEALDRALELAPTDVRLQDRRKEIEGR